MANRLQSSSIGPVPGDRFWSLLDAAPDAILEVDHTGCITLVNAVAEKLFGYSREELMSAPVDMLVPESLRNGHAAHRKAYAAEPRTRPMGVGHTLQGKRKNGSLFPVEISLSPIQHNGDLRVIAIIRDVSERKHAELQLRQERERYTKELELRNKEIERANSLKSEFLASVSHELRTPLHSIIGFSELLGEELHGPLNDKQKRFVHHIHRDSLHLLELINDVLDLSKIEAGRLELRREPFDFSVVVEESVESLAAQAQAKSIKVSSEVNVPGAVIGDRLRVKQILVNLLSNAVKFTPEHGKVAVRVAIEKGNVVASVSDTGIGIPSEERLKIFDKFYQVGNTTKGVREGTGLGLAITKRLVEEHGGTIELKSVPGRGTTFTFRLPAEPVRARRPPE